MNYLEKLKNISKEKNKQNLFFILIMLIVILISMNYIFSNNTKTEEKKSQEEQLQETQENSQDNSLEQKLQNVISQINGIEEVSIIINYKNNGQNNFVFNTKESMGEDGNVINVEKEVAYNENNSQKSAISSEVTTPEVEGVIIVAKGVDSAEIKQKLQTAVGALLGISSYKVQILSK